MEGAFLGTGFACSGEFTVARFATTHLALAAFAIAATTAAPTAPAAPSAFATCAAILRGTVTVHGLDWRHGDFCFAGRR